MSIFVQGYEFEQQVCSGKDMVFTYNKRPGEKTIFVKWYYENERAKKTLILKNITKVQKHHLYERRAELKDGRLIIANMTRSDSGYYIQELHYKNDIKEKSIIYLKVIVPPSGLPYIRETLEENNLVLTCFGPDFKGYPEVKIRLLSSKGVDQNALTVRANDSKYKCCLFGDATSCIDPYIHGCIDYTIQEGIRKDPAEDGSIRTDRTKKDGIKKDHAEEKDLQYICRTTILVTLVFLWIFPLIIYLFLRKFCTSEHLDGEVHIQEPFSLMVCIQKYEKIILMIICFVTSFITAILISFSACEIPKEFKPSSVLSFILIGFAVFALFLLVLVNFMQLLSDNMKEKVDQIQSRLDLQETPCKLENKDSKFSEDNPDHESTPSPERGAVRRGRGGCRKSRSGRETVERGRGTRRERGGARALDEPNRAVEETMKEKNRHLMELIASLDVARKDELLFKAYHQCPYLVLESSTQARVTNQGFQPLTEGAAPSWCTCSRCRDMPTEDEKVCCERAPAHCLSTFPDFNQIALDTLVLSLTQSHGVDIFAYASDVDNKKRRQLAYRNCSRWMHGYLGPRNRRALPSCCVWKIRDRFPDKNGQYMGFVAG